MQFMSIYTWEPEKRDEVMRRIGEWRDPEGLKVIKMWSDITGGRCFVLWEGDDPRPWFAAAHFGFADITKEEAVPVMETAEVMQLLSKP